LRSFRDRRDWAQFHTPKDLAISVSVEAGELLELFQWAPAHAAPSESLIKDAASEAADVLIYLMLFADRLGFDLLDAANSKVAENERRFPEAQSFGVAKPAKDN
jgi:NTP pyrophosphatase (non-canonical NTP hydrolase)